METLNKDELVLNYLATNENHKNHLKHKTREYIR